ncbi:hypothetical protein [Rubrivirga sp.]|uniref:hypothetical protein n=1 Tax=Rubrivirga sp. TaxID=1885344 RepID=UPI003C771FDE
MVRRPILALAVVALASSGCVQFQTQQLYAGLEAAPTPERPRTIALAVEPTIYSDADDDQIWFQDDARCTQGRLVEDVVFEGERAVAVSWDRSTEGCEWAGLGVGWDGWAGKDLSQVLPYAAVQMRVRAAQGRMFGLPIVLTLEDYSGGMGFAYTDNKYFEEPFLNEDWQTITVPLADFDIAAPGAKALDPTNVKQLMFELQQSGSIYLDDIELVWYDPEPQEPWIVLPERPDPAALPITLFDDAFINDDGWGLVTDGCQSIQTEAESGRGEVLRLAWDVRADDCYEGAMGVSWNQWYPTDVSSIAESGVIQFDARLSSGTAEQAPVRVALEDYGRQTSQVVLDGRFVDSGRLTSEWQTVTIPFIALRGGGRELAAAPATVGNLPEFQDGADFSAIKHLVFFLDESGEILIDDLRLITSE